MRCCPLPADEKAVHRFVEALWLPYHRELDAVVERHALADDVDVVAREVEYRVDRLEGSEHRAWVAVADPRAEEDGDPATGAGDPTVDDAPLAAGGPGRLAGFVTTDLDEAPTVFDRPDRVVLGDLYVRERYRGTGLARALVDRAVARASAADCGELALDVDVDNDRAIAFYESLGFEPHRQRMTVGVEDVETAGGPA
ncbi:MAG: GNAT family N-acetyltransferase [Halobacteriaceae archaeon]